MTSWTHSSKGDYGRSVHLQKMSKVSVPIDQAGQAKEQCAAFPSFSDSQGGESWSCTGEQADLCCTGTGKLFLRQGNLEGEDRCTCSWLWRIIYLTFKGSSYTFLPYTLQ